MAIACSGDKTETNAPPTTPAPTPATDPAPTPASTDATTAAPPSDPPPATPPAEPPPAPPPTTAMNLTVLPKSWTKKQVTDYMKNTVSAGLGVKCDFCHVKGDPAADTDHKTEARAMIRMTDETNQRFFGGKARITCMTCHNGKEEPAGE